MWDKFYIVTFDKGGILDNFNYQEFHNNLTTANGVLGWWHYLESTYIIKVEFGVNATNISEYIRGVAPNKRFFVCKLNLDDHNGWLSQEAWDWINTNK